jgi:hypothetical protein
VTRRCAAWEWHVAATLVGLLGLVCWVGTSISCFFMALGIHNIR